MRDQLAANSTYVSLFAGPRSLLSGYTYISAPVSTRKKIFDSLSVTKMRRDARPPSHAAGGSVSTESSCKGFDNFLLDLQRLGGSNTN